MKTDKLRDFLSINAIDYNNDDSNKTKWLRFGKAALKELAKGIEAEAILNINPSGDIDRGYVSGFFLKNGKVAYVSLNDGMKDILYRSAKDTKDYTGGSNNTSPLIGRGFDNLTDWLKNYFG